MSYSFFPLTSRARINYISAPLLSPVVRATVVATAPQPRVQTKMKLPLLVVFTFILILGHSECRHTSSWFPSIFDTFTNRTTQLTNYVRERGRRLRNYYVESVRNKFTSYLGINSSTTTEYPDDNGDKQSRIKRKFRDFTETEATEPIGFNTVAPNEIEDKCKDDDPTVLMTTPQLIAIHGYPAESHTIVTDDGYILTVHRIPYSKKASSKVISRKTVLLHHGLLGSSADWVIPGPKRGLAYILSEAGYDVWLANVRGNTYSRAHVSRSIDSFEFWNFTFHEVSQHDLPAVIDYIMEVKGWDVKINYIGHSMGTTVLFALLSTKTHYNKVLRAGFALAPVAYMTEIKSPIRLLAKFSQSIEYLLKLLGANEFLPQNAVLRWLSKHMCEINHYEQVICENSMFVLCGYDEKEFNKTLLPSILGHVPAGASTKTLIHYAQEIRNEGKFQMFDFGEEGNFKQYGSITPPEYPIHKITLPIALFSSQNDWLSGDIDVTNLYVQLVNPIDHYIVPLKEFNHIDFLWAIDAPSLVYSKLLQLMEEGVSKPYADMDILDTNLLDD
ncbi:gastric triacylglycerol lipase-like [Trichoplusia ni]|uniref:Gastric triacylglycerol lipase-like n=1 Tax=Trichoplusia ni TaxID=7111 RepID=A0A7E5W7L1_TRINI|nr:gastric triacylglycerol lipase-like [Trichoplusia ni]